MGGGGGGVGGGCVGGGGGGGGAGGGGGGGGRVTYSHPVLTCRALQLISCAIIDNRLGMRGYILGHHVTLCYSL